MLHAYNLIGNNLIQKPRKSKGLWAWPIARQSTIDYNTHRNVTLLRFFVRMLADNFCDPGSGSPFHSCIICRLRPIYRLLACSSTVPTTVHTAHYKLAFVCSRPISLRMESTTT